MDWREREVGDWRGIEGGKRMERREAGKREVGRGKGNCKSDMALKCKNHVLLMSSMHKVTVYALLVNYNV